MTSVSNRSVPTRVSLPEEATPGAHQEDSRLSLVLWLLACVCIPLWLAGCGGSDPAPPPPTEGSATVGAAGGVVDGPDGTQLVVPPGALSADVLIRIARSRVGAPDLPAGTSPSVPVYELTPHGVVFGRPVQLKIPANPQGGSTESAWAAEPGGPWSTVAARVENGFLVVDRISLSWFTYFVPGSGDAIVKAADIARPFQSDPAGALRYETVEQPGAPPSLWTRMVLSETATLRLPLKFTALPGCTDGELEVESWFQPHLSPTLPRQTVLRQPIGLAAPASGSPEAVQGVWVGQYTFVTTLSGSSRGRQYYYFKYSCLYDSQARTFSQAHTDPIYVEPAGPVAPTFTLSPVTTQVVAGQPASFTAIAQGRPAPSISWQVAPAGGAFTDVVAEPDCAPTPAPSSGAETSASCRLSNTPFGNNGQRYRAIARNVAAPSGLASSEAVLTITAAPVPPAITNQPSNQTTTVGGNASFSVTATGTAPLAYTWRLNGTTLPASGTFSVGSCSGNVSYANGGATATLSALTAGCNGVSVDMTVSNGVNPNAASNSVVLTVNPVSSWTPQNTSYIDPLVAISVIDNTTAWAAGPGGDVLRTTDGGAIWNPRATGATDLRSISAVDANTAWAVGGEFIVKTTDGGQTWARQGGTTPSWFLYSVSAVNSNVAWAVGFGGDILKTTDGGANWITQVAATGSAESLFSVAAVDANTAWAVGNRRILKTVDGGVNWVSQTTTGLNHNQVVAATDRVAWVVINGAVLRTVNGGDTWSEAANLPVAARSLSAIRGNTTMVWALSSVGTGGVGAGSSAHVSTNGGVSWTSETVPGSGVLYQIGAIDGNRAWIVGDSGRILKR